MLTADYLLRNADKRHANMRLSYNRPLSTHPNPSLKKGGAPLRRKFGAHSPSLFQGGGQGVGTIQRFYTARCQVIRFGVDCRHADGRHKLPCGGLLTEECR